ncbi:HugZ family protein [Fulvimarina endophytica]|uniref:HugZ family protein n=1 Tax=Fulvimarina endophytica TaxID=2293836 RepID=A0A371XAN2_9HYPH|nr:DUF2470 domain-containing protein [Fulvimarina endophytica]RFC66269.1 HugZ family protein [Fulvimarina endophytica]
MTDEQANLLLQPVDEDTRHAARVLIRGARFGALAVRRPEDGFPTISRSLCTTDFLGRPSLLFSHLASHSKALEADGRCSLLVGEPGKGDPLAHPRLSVSGHARIVDRSSEEGERLRTRFLARHPKAALYIDFPDFRFAVIEPSALSLNGGFGRASELKASDVVDDPAEGLEDAAGRAIAHMNEDHADAIDRIAHAAGAKETGWRVATADRKGCEIIRSDRLMRIEFPIDAAGEGGYRAAFVSLLPKAD